MMRLIYNVLRIACYIGLPLFFQQTTLMPQPVKNMLSAFMIATTVAELFQYFLRKLPFLRYIPAIATFFSIYPYLSQFRYFEAQHQMIIIGTFLLSLGYAADRKFLYPLLHS